jgi:hypothetical protein
MGDAGVFILVNPKGICIALLKKNCFIVMKRDTNCPFGFFRIMIYAEEWVLKDTVSSVQLFGEKYHKRSDMLDSDSARWLICIWITMWFSFFHPVNINS